jgi:hypothetical protein
MSTRSIARPAPKVSTPKFVGGARKQFTRKQRVLITAANFAVFFTVWELAPLILDVPKLFLPRFSEVLAEIPAMHEEGILLENLWISLRVYLTGMVLAVGISIPLGLLLGAVKTLDRIISPYLWVIYTTPLIILMPLILLWVGINDTARVLLLREKAEQCWSRTGQVDAWSACLLKSGSVVREAGEGRVSDMLEGVHKGRHALPLPPLRQSARPLADTIRRYEHERGRRYPVFPHIQAAYLYLRLVHWPESCRYPRAFPNDHISLLSKDEPCHNDYSGYE